MTNTSDKDRENSESFKVFGREVEPEDFLSIAATDNVAFHFGQSAEDAVLARLFHNMTEGFYVDVGAFHPTQYSNTFLLHRFFGWSGINIDASRESIDLFNKERPNDINVQVGVGEKRGEMTFYKFDHPARNTLSKDNVERQIGKGDAKIVGEEKVSVMPLTDILSQYLPDGKNIDLMNIDIEGFDLVALKTNNWTRFRPRVLLIEDYSLAQEGLGSSPIHKFLNGKNYRFHSHTFDTSIYVEKSFKTPERPQTALPALNKRVRDAYLDDMETAYRASILTDLQHPEVEVQKLDAKKEQNKRNREKLQELERSYDELQGKIDSANQEARELELKYQKITTSKAWHYLGHARRLSGRVKSAAKRKQKR
jgi:FkbM family methyltransferase